jgi:hypothetical protein
MPKNSERIEPTFGDGPVPVVDRSTSAGASPISSRKVPLSRAPGKKKLLVGVPLSVVSGLAYFAGLGSLAQMLFVAFTAYAVVGLLEVLLGASLSRAGEAFARLAWWKRGLVSLVVIVGAIVFAIAVIPAVLR